MGGHWSRRWGRSGPSGLATVVVGISTGLPSKVALALSVGHNRRVKKNGLRSGQDWAADLVRCIGKAAKDRRGGRSAKWLSERTAELGYRISPTVIAKLDSGHRGEVLSVPELLVIAAALEVPPVALLYPNMPDGEVEVLPGVVRPAPEAIETFSADIPLDIRQALDAMHENAVRIASEVLELRARLERCC